MKPIKFSKKEKKKLKPINPNINDIVVVGNDFCFIDPKRTNRLVLIISGQYQVNGRISNYWHWRDINQDGSLGEENSGYGNFFKPKNKYNLIQRVELEGALKKQLNGCYA